MNRVLLPGGRVAVSCKGGKRYPWKLEELGAHQCVSLTCVGHAAPLCPVCAYIVERLERYSERPPPSSLGQLPRFPR